MIRGLRTTIGSICLLLCALALAVLPLIFSASWYEFNCQFHHRCANLDPTGVTGRVENMGRYFLHQQPLASDWDSRGAQHLADVRNLYDRMAVVAVTALVVLLILLFQRPAELASYAKGALIVLLISTLILPLFGLFWEKAFHPLLFDNDLWRTRPGEVLWSLTPRVFFRNSAALLLALSAVGCAVLWWIGARRTAK